MTERILVTCVGGGVGQSIIKALQDTSYEVVGIDSEELAVGLHALSNAYKGFYVDDPRYIDRLLEVCKAEGCSLLFPGHDAELTPLSENAGKFMDAGTTPIVSSPDVVRICDDKLETNRFLKARGFAVPETKPLGECTEAPDFPVILKLRRGGARSRGLHVVRNPREFDYYCSVVDAEDYIIQEYIEGNEYTCGSVTLDGKCFGVIVMRRVLRDGDTYKAFVERNRVIESVVREIAESLKPFGACNVQLRLKDGAPCVFEINARCSGTTAARALAGFNEPKMIADYITQGIPPSHSIREISILRYWKELVVENEQIDRLAHGGHRSGQKIPL